MREATGDDEPRLALAEPTEPGPGWPQWIAPALRLSRGLDPLGLQTITLDRIMPLLLPGVLVLSQRARLFSLYPFLLAEYQRLGGATTNTALSAFLKEREFDYAVAVQLCPNGCGDNSAGAVGAERARPAGREAKVVSPHRDAPAAGRFFDRAISTTKMTPIEVVTDRAATYPIVLGELQPAPWHRTEQYADNRVEADHGRLTARLGPVRGSSGTGTPAWSSPAMPWSRTCGGDIASWPLRSRRTGGWRLRSTSWPWRSEAR